MGYDICWEEHGECEPLPDKFTRRYVGRQIFQSLMDNSETLKIPTCKCAQNPRLEGKHHYFCDAIDDVRPKGPEEFGLWRQLIKEEKFDCEEIFLEMVDYLERNPNMYLNFSC